MGEQLVFTVQVERPPVLWQQIESYLLTKGYENIHTDDSPIEQWVKQPEGRYFIRIAKVTHETARQQQTVLERIAEDEHRDVLDVYGDVQRMPIVVIGGA